MIFDCFTFFNEREIVYLRVKHLYPYVDKFVVVEANITHRGELKPWNFQEILDTDLNWAKEKIIYVKKEIHDLQSLPETSYAKTYEGDAVGYMTDTVYWRIENAQRNAIIEGLVDSEDDDVIMVSDVDEFPNYQALEELRLIVENFETFCFAMRSFTYYLDIERCIEGTKPWAGTVVGKKKFLTSPQDWRDRRDLMNWQGARGYHFTWLKKYVEQKVRATAHVEIEKYYVPLSEFAKDTSTDLPMIVPCEYVRPDIENDESYPRSILESTLKFPGLFMVKPFSQEIVTPIKRTIVHSEELQ